MNGSTHTRMNRFLTISLAMILGYVSTMAQEKLSPREILDRTAACMQTKGGITAKFTTTSFIGTTPKESIQGMLSMQGDKYVMSTPVFQTWFDGKNQWTLNPESKEVNLVTPTEEELQVSSPTAFLSMYKRGFSLSSNKSTLRGRNIWDVTLRPKKGNQEPSRIVVSIDQETFMPMCLRIRNEGNWTRISIMDINANAGLSDTGFQFPAQEYSDYEVIDMR